VSDRLRVLVVDDQPIILEAVRQIFADAPDVDVIGEHDPSAAEARALAEDPHVVLLDLNMEPVDGLTVLKRLRANPQLTDLSVVMLSTAEEPETKVAAFRHGANDYVVKLPSSLELIARVRYHARAFLAAREREAAFRALMESRAALALRNEEIERQKAKLELMNRDLVEASVTDALTGLRNRRYLKSFFEQPRTARVAFEGDDRRRSAGNDLSFCLFDLDHFKQINDRHGHDAGDAVLVEVARRLRAGLRRDDAALRWGGEEFLVIARGHDEAGAIRMATRILDAIGTEPIRLPGGRDLRVTCSLGFAQFPWRGAALSLDRLLGLADAGAYLCKREGRNRACGVFPGDEHGGPRRVAGCDPDPQVLLEEDGRGVRLVRLPGPGAA
jgi:two-component system chemotaxis family response regulator WspR